MTRDELEAVPLSAMEGAKTEVTVDTNTLAALLSLVPKLGDDSGPPTVTSTAAVMLGNELARSTDGVICAGCYLLPERCARVVGHGKCCLGGCEHVKCCPDCTHPYPGDPSRELP